MKNERLVYIDFLRGLAIFLMIVANFGPLLKTSYPMFIRLAVSLAAPLFIVIAGYMVRISDKKKYSIHYLKRGSLLIFLGAVVDIFSWQILPFYTFDILYLLGFSTLLSPLLLRLSFKKQLILSLILFMVTSLFHRYIGYSSDLVEVSLNEFFLRYDFNLSGKILRQWLLDGWFPLFPWLAFFILGMSFKSIDTCQLKMGMILFLMGIICWIIWPGGYDTRYGAQEIFYPSSFGYSVSYAGLVLVLLYISKISSKQTYFGLNALGKYPLLLYLINTQLVGLLYIFYKQQLSFYFLSILVFLSTVLLYYVSFLAEKYRSKIRSNMLVVRMLFG